MSVYTKRGDRGETSLYNKKTRKEKRVLKDSGIIEAIGTIDELNTFLGVVRSLSRNKVLIREIKEIQRNLFSIGSILAGTVLPFGKDKTKRLEIRIDDLEGKLPVIANFTLPGGSVVGAHLHLARSISRRAERVLVGLSRKNKISPEVLVYLNRLSDFLYILARYENKRKKIKEVIWKG